MDGIFGTGLVHESFYIWNDSLVYFAGADGVNAAGEFVYELFVTDGTAAGTELISDQYTGPEGTNPGSFLQHANRLYFAASDSALGREPYYLDFGTTSIFKPNNDLLITQLPYPNPLSNGVPLNTEVKLPIGAEIHAKLFDLKGQLIQEIQDLGYLPAGTHSLRIPINNHPAGLYYLAINGGGSRASFLVALE